MATLSAAKADVASVQDCGRGGARADERCGLRRQAACHHRDEHRLRRFTHPKCAGCGGRIAAFGAVGSGHPRGLSRARPAHDRALGHLGRRRLSTRNDRCAARSHAAARRTMRISCLPSTRDPRGSSSSQPPRACTCTDAQRERRRYAGHRRQLEHGSASARFSSHRSGPGLASSGHLHSCPASRSQRSTFRTWVKRAPRSTATPSTPLAPVQCHSLPASDHSVKWTPACPSEIRTRATSARRFS